MNSLTTVGSPWDIMEELPHINVLELYAAQLVLTHLAAHCQGSHTAVSYINKMGGGGGGTHSLSCNKVTQDIWDWAISRNIWLSAAYIPGDTNVVVLLRTRNGP